MMCEGKACDMVDPDFSCSEKSLANLWLANNRGEQAVSIRYLWRRSLLIVYARRCTELSATSMRLDDIWSRWAAYWLKT